eukprot:PhF_6_TR29416/c0_g1_i5/m.43486
MFQKQWWTPRMAKHCYVTLCRRRHSWLPAPTLIIATVGAVVVQRQQSNNGRTSSTPRRQSVRFKSAVSYAPGRSGRSTNSPTAHTSRCYAVKCPCNTWRILFTKPTS